MNDLLKFSVYASSVTDKDTSTSFPAENLLSDNPLDPTSRWSAGPNVSGDAWIIFELEKLSLIKGITFGKFHKPHPCNVKEFKISVGDTPHCSREMITSTLRNDSLPEHFNLPEEDPSGVQHPCLYLKISIRSTHGQNFSPSLWHISIRGQTDFTGAQLSSQELENLRQQRALLYVLKHLRQNNLQVSYRALLLETASSLEHPVVTALHHAIVQEADWKRAEELLYLAERKGLLDHGRLRMSWTDCPFSMVHPGPRSDSTICLDASQPLLYLYSGFSGSNLRDDLWLFNMNDYSWILLDDCVSQHGGPPYGGRRTMIADSTNGSLYLMTLGMNERLDDFKNLPLNYTDVSLASFFRFSTRGFSKGTWECLPTIIAPDFLSKSLLTAELRMDRVNGAIYMSAIVQDIGDREHIFIYSFDAECRGWRSLVRESLPQGLLFGQVSKGVSVALHLKDDDPNVMVLYIALPNHTLPHGFGAMSSALYAYHVSSRSLAKLADVPGLGKHPQLFLDQISEELCVFLDQRPGRLFVFDIQSAKFHNKSDDSSVGIEYPKGRMLSSNLAYDEKNRSLFFCSLPPASIHDWRICFNLSIGQMQRNLFTARQSQLFFLRCQEFSEIHHDQGVVPAISFMRTHVAPLLDQDEPAQVELVQNLIFQSLTHSTSQNIVESSRLSSDTPLKHPHHVDDINASLSSMPTQYERATSLQFAQRTKTFQLIMEHFATGSKEPSGDLVQLLGPSLDL